MSDTGGIEGRETAGVDAAVASLRAGEAVVIPTDTVYGLACLTEDERSVRKLSQLKSRPSGQPIALVAAAVDTVLEHVPELRGRAEEAARALLPGPFTLVLPNPGRRLPWLAGDRPETIGVRVPELTGVAAELLSRVGAVAATSANRHGEPDPRRIEDVPDEFRGALVVLDGGLLPGTPSTVLDLTGPVPVVLREGAVPAEVALARVAVTSAQ